MRADKAAFLGDVSFVRIKCESRRTGHARVGRDFTAPLENVLRLRAKQYGQRHFLALLLFRGQARSDDLVALRTANVPGFQRAGLDLVLAQNMNPFGRAFLNLIVLLQNVLALADVDATVFVRVRPARIATAHAAGVGVAVKHEARVGDERRRLDLPVKVCVALGAFAVRVVTNARTLGCDDVLRVQWHLFAAGGAGAKRGLHPKGVDNVRGREGFMDYRIVGLLDGRIGRVPTYPFIH